MERIRKPLQGTVNIIRFNWHFFAISAGLILLLVAGSYSAPPAYHKYTTAGAMLATIAMLIPLAVSCYVYDLSNLYQLPWLENIQRPAGGRLVNIHAGYDETSKFLHNKYPQSSLVVFDFYDPEKHTEVSIRRARKLYSPYPGTIAVSTTSLPMDASTADLVCLSFAAHEVRCAEKQVQLFREVKRVLSANGQIAVTEHLRDLPNFLAYNAGFLHFHSRRRWLNCFCEAGLAVQAEIKTTPFVTTFILEHDRTTS